MKTHLRPLPLAMSILLAACASNPTQSPQTPAIQAPQPVVADIAHNVGTINSPAVPKPQADVWEQLRGSFAMNDCDADPAIMDWAHRYTAQPQRFEAQVREIMPHLVYVQQIAAKHGVAGEFALLPWVESHYRSIPGSKNNPAGMWQIMPVTANAMGMRVDKRYDGRLDVPAATDAVMALLRRYQDDLQDWRLTDYAYNAGEFGIRKMVDQHGMPASEPAIPRLPVKRITKEHLIKLLAMACVVRQPERFHVSLPSLPSDQRLVSVDVNRTMPIAQAADHAGMPVDQLKNLNAAFRNGVVDPQAASYLLLPNSQAEKFRLALLQPIDKSDGAQEDTALISSAPMVDQSTTAATTKPTRKAKKQTHTVKSGETLWNIARTYSVDVKQLEHWNNLHGQKLKLGQVLQVSESSGSS
ncbi:LysM peptidoglycan-binding domain-containing protein [Dyella silvatica]|uniref:LysM peptidoglycan-binding domain-containing protein n=1 Tax=Dyella silvatica TaxID=2992128 RepID=UPI002B1CB5CA|nr:LysM peptidoglycan-binding domain-containing protein [Dyella silvatica]